MNQEKYVAYVGTYTHGSSIGIHLYDVDVEEERSRNVKWFRLTILPIWRVRKTENTFIRLRMRESRFCDSSGRRFGIY